MPCCCLQGVVERARQHGYLQTISGRRRWLPHISSPNWEKRGHNERVAVNGTVQGSAADLVKGAMVQLLSDLREQGLSQHCKMMVQVGRLDGGQGKGGEHMFGDALFVLDSIVGRNCVGTMSVWGRWHRAWLRSRPCQVGDGAAAV